MSTESLVICTILFSVGLTGVVINRNHFVRTLLSMELMLLATSLLFLTSSEGLVDRNGEVFALVVLAVAAAETALGLSIAVAYYGLTRDISIKSIGRLKG